MPFEMSGFFPLFWGKLGSGDLIPTKLHMSAGQLLGTDHCGGLRSNVQQNGTEHDRSIPFARLMPLTKAQVRPYAAAARPSFRDAISAPFRRFVIFWKAISRATSGEP